MSNLASRSSTVPVLTPTQRPSSQGTLWLKLICATSNFHLDSQINTSSFIGKFFLYFFSLMFFVVL